jgi:hypothetical protein
LVRNIIILILICGKSFGQTSDTLTKCKAWTNTFLPTSAYGLTSNGHLYNVAFIQHFDSLSNRLEPEVVRIDITAGTVTYKKMPNAVSSGFLWQFVKDTLGNIYFGLNDRNRKIWKFNFKDSIQATNLGNCFNDGQALAYSYGLDWNNHVYFGASSGDVYWSEYNPATNTLTQHPSIYGGHQYVLSITGDDNYAYAQTGQQGDIRLYSIRKSDNLTTLLFKIPNTTRFNLRQLREGVYVSFNTDTLSGAYHLHDGIATSSNGVFPSSTYIEDQYKEVESFRENQYFDDLNSQMTYTARFPASYTVNATIPVNSDTIESAIGRVFSFPNDTVHIYYSGITYGAFYDYNRVTNTVTKLGSTGLNAYSFLAVNDSIMYIGNYPNGSLIKWNRNKPWTLLTAQNGVVVQLSKTSNPSLCGDFRAYAGFHHCTLLIQDKYGNIVGAGGVIRVNNTCSIGVYNPVKDSMYGYDYNKIDDLSESELSVFRDHILFATNNENGGTPKIYFYNSLTNQMDDSLSIPGYKAYSHIYVIGDLLIGSSFGDASNNYYGKLFKINLRTKRVLMDSTLNSTIGSNGLFGDGKFYINTTATKMKKLFLYTLLLSLLVSNAKATTYYFSNSGLTSNTGTQREVPGLLLNLLRLL